MSCLFPSPGWYLDAMFCSQPVVDTASEVKVRSLKKMMGCHEQSIADLIWDNERIMGFKNCLRAFFEGGHGFYGDFDGHV